MRVLAVSAHPDDETLGAGGTLLKLRSRGAEVHWLIATQAHEPAWSAETIRAKADEVDRVAKAYGMHGVHKLGFPTTRLETVPIADLMTAVSGVIAKVAPEVVYVVHEGDIHTDHRALNTALMSVLKPFNMRKQGVRRILAYETLSSTDAAPAQAARMFLPTVFSDITAHLDQKVEIMRMFSTEVQPEPMPRASSSLRALARVRGATIGVEAAEAFMLLRECEP